MKKLLAVLLAAAMLFALGAGALAEEIAGLTDETAVEEIVAEPLAEGVAAQVADPLDKEQALALYNETKAVFDSKEFTLISSGTATSIEITALPGIPVAFVRNGDATAFELSFSCPAVVRKPSLGKILLDLLIRVLAGSKVRNIVTPEYVITAFPGRLFYQYLGVEDNEDIEFFYSQLTSISFYIYSWFDLPEVTEEDIEVTQETLDGKTYLCVAFPNPDEDDSMGRLYFLDGKLSRIAYTFSDGHTEGLGVQELLPEADLKYFSIKGMMKLSFNGIVKIGIMIQNLINNFKCTV